MEKNYKLILGAKTDLLYDSISTKVLVKLLKIFINLKKNENIVYKIFFNDFFFLCFLYIFHFAMILLEILKIDKKKIIYYLLEREREKKKKLIQFQAFVFVFSIFSHSNKCTVLIKKYFKKKSFIHFF